jgi:hypothetical protein
MILLTQGRILSNVLYKCAIRSLRNMHLVRIAKRAHFICEKPRHFLGVI